MDFWSRQVTANSSNPSGIPYNTSVAPWNTGNHPSESFAETYRYFLGSNATRSVSQTPATGINNPASNPHWKKQLQLMPELTGYWDSYGLLDNLSWQGDATSGYWQFRNNSSEWIAQTGPYSWFKWNGSSWVNFNPTYSVH